MKSTGLGATTAALYREYVHDRAPDGELTWHAPRGTLPLDQSAYGRIVDYWTAAQAGGAARVTVLGQGAEWTPLPARSCSYCRVPVVGQRVTCANCGAPATS